VFSLATVGYGVVGNVGAAVTPQQQVALDVAQCEQGYYSAGGALNTVCTLCPPLTTTADVGNLGIEDCNSKWHFSPAAWVQELEPYDLDTR
jgi:hypothetical protein